MTDRQRLAMIDRAKDIVINLTAGLEPGGDPAEVPDEPEEDEEPS